MVKTQPAQQFKVTRELRRRILRVFEANDIDVPNGQRMLIREEPEEDEDDPRTAADPSA